MPLQAPVLDDRRFEDIISEVKSYIPRYTREWTNHNESDPGITLAELFAWLTELLIYRLNQVPELNYIMFLRLLGIQLGPAQPARAELTFTLARNDVDTVVIPQETEVAVGGGANPPIIFETDRSLIALGATLAKVQSFDGFGYSDESTRNGVAGQWFYPFGAHAHEGAALLLGFDTPLNMTSQQVDLAVYVLSGFAPLQAVSCDTSSAPLQANTFWECWDGASWRPLSLTADETRGFVQSGHIFFDGPGSTAARVTLGRIPTPLYWIRCRLGASQYERPPRLTGILTNTVRASQALTVRDEVVGGSDGSPSQSFTLESAPVVVLDKPHMVANTDGTRATITSLRLEIDEGHGFMSWQQVDDFFGSGPDDPHFMLDRTTGSITLGDGHHGRIPVANPTLPRANIMARLYRHGGGPGGNTGAGSITELQSFVESVKSVTNILPATGGSAEETLAQAKLRAAEELKSKDRAVTAEDFEFLAEQTPGARVLRAQSFPLLHQSYPDALIPGVVTVAVVPDGDAPNPMPSQSTLQLVCAHLNRHRLLTCEVFVAPPTYRLVKIEADIVVKPEADLSVVKKAVESALTTYFHPLHGGEDGAGWPFNGTIYFARVYRLVLDVPGVDRVRDGQLVIWLGNEAQPFCRDVPLGPGVAVLLYSEGHDVRAAYDMSS
jgi:predicted phage baseplate assembly protein